MPRKSSSSSQDLRSARPASEAQLAKVEELATELTKPRRGRMERKPLVASPEHSEKIAALPFVKVLFTREVGPSRSLEELHFALDFDALKGASSAQVSTLLDGLLRQKKARMVPVEPVKEEKSFVKPLVNARRIGRV